MAARTGPARELGDLFLYSIPLHLEIPTERFHEAARQCGIPGWWLPKPVAPLFAFKRAAHQLRAESAHQLLSLGSTKKVMQTAVYVREAPKQAYLRHVIKEIRRGADKPEYLTLGTVAYADGLHFTCTAQDPALVQEFDELKQRLEERYQACQSKYVNKDVQHLMLRAMRLLQALPVRNSGGVFFIPLLHRAPLHRLARFLDALGGESDTFIVHNTPLEAERLAAKLHHVIEADLHSAQGRIHELQLQGYIPACRLRHWRDNLAYLQALSKTYEGLLAADLAPAQAALQQTEDVLQAVAA